MGIPIVASGLFCFDTLLGADNGCNALPVGFCLFDCKSPRRWMAETLAVLDSSTPISTQPASATAETIAAMAVQ
jgi:hypothetical protein